MPQRFTYNARTGELRGITTLKIGDPQVTVEEFVTSYISNNKSEVYDSDLVVATVLKNLDIAALTSGGGSGTGVTDSDLAVVAKLRADADSDSVAIQALSEYIDNQIQIVNNSIDSKFDSEYLRVNDRFTNVDAQLSIINQRLDSDDATFSAVKSRVFGLVKDNDSDHNKELNLIQSDADSDEAALAGFKRFTLGQNASGPNNNLHEYYRATGGFGSNPFHDSDLVIASALKGINTTATYDSDRVIQTIRVAGGTVLKDDFVDSDEVYNMGGEHGWFYDSDRVMDTVDKNFVTIINFVNNNLGKVDSEFVLTMVDSEEVVNMFREHNLVTKDILDSETARIQLLLSNADSDQIAIAERRRDADSDTLVIQALKTQADVDSAYITLIRNDLDSDSTGIQAIRTDMDSESARINTRLSSIDSSVSTVQSTQTVQNSRLATLEARSDSDEIKLQSIQEQVNQLRLEQDSDSANSGGSGGGVGAGITDSDLKVVADLRNDLDSDFTAFNTRITSNFNDIQTLNSTTNSQGGRITLLELSRDSESAKVQALQGSVDTNTATLNAYGGRISILETNADSDEIAIQTISTAVGVLQARADSDEIAIQTLDTKVTDLQARADSDELIIQDLQTQITTVNTNLKADIDSETARIQLLLATTDSDALSLAETRRDAESDAAAIVIIKQNAESDSAAIQALQSQLAPRLDSDEIKLQLHSGRLDVLEARADSDELALQALDTAISALDTNLSARLDSDETVIQDLNSRVEVLEALDSVLDSDLKVVSDLRNDLDSESIQIRALRSDADSDSVKIQLMSGQIAALEAGTYDDSQLVARLDSDTIAISALRADVDSDSLRIQDLQTQITNLDIAAIRADADSDSIAIQAIRTSVDSDYALFNAKIALFNGLTDSDLTTVAELRNDVDSDSTKLQALQETVGNLNSLSREDSDIINQITGARLVDTVQVIGGSQTDVDSFLANDIRAAKYIVVVSSDSDSTYQTDELLVVHDGSAAYVTQYGQINTADSELATFDASLTAGSVYLKATGTRNNIRFDAQRLQVNVANGSIIINGVSSLVVDSDDVGTYAASFGNETRFNTAISRDPSNGGTNADLMTTRLAVALQDECDNFPANTGNLQYGHFVFYNNGSPVYDFCAAGVPSIFNNRLNPGDITVTSSNNSTQSTFRVSFPTNLVFSPQFEGTTYNPSQWTAGNQGNTEFDEFRLYLNNNTTGVTEANSTLAFSATVAALTAP